MSLNIHTFYGLVILATYLHAYTLISVTVTVILTVFGAIKLIKMNVKDAVFSTILSVSQPSPSTSHSTHTPPIKVRHKNMKKNYIIYVLNPRLFIHKNRYFIKISKYSEYEISI